MKATEQKDMVEGLPEPALTENSRKVLEKRYLKRNEEGTVVETATDMFARVAWTIAGADLAYGKSGLDVDKTADEFYRLMASFEFLPNSPTLMNAGRELGQLSACFVLPVGDSMEEIFEAVKNTALIHKSGGGTGFSFSRLRPKKDRVKSTKGVSSGPLSFMTVFDSATETVRQGGTRRGANMGILRVDHPDIMEFITCKQQNDQLNNFNISVAVTDAFMNALRASAHYDLVNPRTRQVVGCLDAHEVWIKIVENAWKNGDPGIVFIDRMNAANPTPSIGQIEATNPCGEQPLLPYESCNLGSINLARMAVNAGREWALDFEKLRRTVRTAVHFLDNVIDVNRYPIPQIAEVTLANRKIGLGVMGFADLLYLMGIPYDSEEAVDLAGEIMEFITREGRLASADLARDRGAFPNFKGSIYDNGKDPVRNATVTTIAPTGTISLIAGCASGIEPTFALSFTRQNVLDGAGDNMVETNPIFERVARERCFYSEDLMTRIAANGRCRGIDGVPEDVQRIFVTAHDITPEWHIKMQAAFQVFTDNAVSKTVNFPHSATVEDVRKAYELAYRNGCKGVTIYRDGSRGEQVLNIGKPEKEHKEEKAGQETHVQKKSEKAPRFRPPITYGVTQKISTGCGSIYLTINEDEKGICEIFSVMGRSGGCAASQAEALGRMVSLAFRSGVSVDSVVKQLKGIRCPSPAWLPGGSIMSCSDAIGKALENYAKNSVGNDHPRKAAARPGPSLIDQEDEGYTGKNMLGIHPECPDCGNMLVFGEGCALCKACGFSKCL